MWDYDYVSLERAKTLLELLISKHGFNLNENYEFAEEIIHFIAYYSRYACNDDSPEQMQEYRREAQLFHEKLEVLVQLNTHGYSYFNKKGSYVVELKRANEDLRHNEDGTVTEDSLRKVKSRVAYLEE